MSWRGVGWTESPLVENHWPKGKTDETVAKERHKRCIISKAVVLRRGRNTVIKKAVCRVRLDLKPTLLAWTYIHTHATKGRMDS